ncbi:MAG TPA: hypothetical protein PKZ57_01765 [Methanoregulaceae archaeon]|nr:hypothetical protein [Methanoregulaceae archaeon]
MLCIKAEPRSSSSHFHSARLHYLNPLADELYGEVMGKAQSRSVGNPLPLCSPKDPEEKSPGLPLFSGHTLFECFEFR